MFMLSTVLAVRLICASSMQEVPLWGRVIGGAFYLYGECFQPTLPWGDGHAFAFIALEPGKQPLWRAARSRRFPAPMQGTECCM